MLTKNGLSIVATGFTTIIDGSTGSAPASGANKPATAAITDITGHTFSTDLPFPLVTHNYYQNETSLNANVYLYSDGVGGWVIAPSDANLIPKIVLTKNGNSIVATGFTDITSV